LHRVENFFGESRIPQLGDCHGSILHHVVKHRRDPRGLAVLPEHEPQRVRDVRRAGLVPLAEVRFYGEKDRFVEACHEEMR